MADQLSNIDVLFSGRQSSIQRIADIGALVKSLAGTGLVYPELVVSLPIYDKEAWALNHD